MCLPRIEPRPSAFVFVFPFGISISLGPSVSSAYIFPPLMLLHIFFSFLPTDFLRPVHVLFMFILYDCIQSRMHVTLLYPAIIYRFPPLVESHIVLRSIFWIMLRSWSLVRPYRLGLVLKRSKHGLLLAPGTPNSSNNRTIHFQTIVSPPRTGCDSSTLYGHSWTSRVRCYVSDGL